MSLGPGHCRLAAAVVFFALTAGGPLFAQRNGTSSTPIVETTVIAEPAESPDVTVMRALRSKTTFHVEIMPLGEFVKFLSNKHNLHFKLDPDGLKRARVDRSTPISADIDGVPLSEALQEVLGRLDLVHRVVDGEILITRRPRDAPDVPVVEPVVPQPQFGMGGGMLIRRAGPQGQGVQFFVLPQRDVGLLFLAQLPVELRFVQRVCAPTKEQMRAIKADLEAFLREAGKGSSDSSCELFPGKLAACVVRHLSQADAAHFLDEVRKHETREREACVYTFVTLLDQRIGLADEQRQSLIAAFEAHWKPGWSQQIEMAVRNADEEMPAIPDKLIVPLLDGEQARLWQGMPKEANDNPRFDPDRMGSVGTPLDDPDTHF